MITNAFPNTVQNPIFEHILVAVDDSEQAQYAFAVALRVAQGLGARISLVHAVAPEFREDLAYDPGRRADRLKLGRSLLERFKQRVGSIAPVEIHVREGDPCTEILTVAKCLPRT